VWDFKPGADPEDVEIVRAMKGKKMPQVGRIEISIMEEDQSRLLAFENGELDLMNMEGPLAPKVLDGGNLRPEFARKGIKLSRFVDPEISYHYWNIQDPVVGGSPRRRSRCAARWRWPTRSTRTSRSSATARRWRRTSASRRASPGTTRSTARA